MLLAFTLVDIPLTHAQTEDTTSKGVDGAEAVPAVQPEATSPADPAVKDKTKVVVKRKKVIKKVLPKRPVKALSKHRPG